jgi:hypothetical protein
VTTRLSDLDPHLLKILDERTYQFEGVPFAEGQGVQFDCPVCFERNGRSSIGVHAVICWFDGKGVPAQFDPKPGRWTPAGTGLEDLTLNAPSFTPARSVLLTGGCGAHFFVTNGEVTLV